MRTLILVSVLFLSFHSQAVQLSGQANALACSSLFLENHFSDVAEGRGPGAIVGHYQDLPYLLQQAGLPGERGEIFYEIIKFFENSQSPSNPVVRSLLEYLNSSDVSQVVLCFLKEGSLLKNGKDVTYLQNDSAPLPRPDSPRVRRIRSDLSPVRTVVISNPLSIYHPSEMYVWGALFFAEISQAADRDLIQRWIQANTVLLAHDKQPDPLFLEHVRQHAGEYVAEEGFVHFFETVRSAIAYVGFLRGAYLMLNPLNLNEVAQWRTDKMQEVIAKIEAHPTAGDLLSKYGLKNLEKIAIQLGETMKQTLQAASRF